MLLDKGLSAQVREGQMRPMVQAPSSAGSRFVGIVCTCERGPCGLRAAAIPHRVVAGKRCQVPWWSRNSSGPTAWSARRRPLTGPPTGRVTCGPPVVNTTPFGDHRTAHLGLSVSHARTLISRSRHHVT